MNKIVDQALIQKKVEESKDYNATNIMILNILFALGVIVSLVMYMCALYDVEDFKENYIWIPLVILLIIVVLALLVMIKGLMQKREFIELNPLITKNLNAALNEEYKQYY